MKKLFAILLALTLVLSLGVTAFAATVTVPEGDTHSYVAYQIFTGSQAVTEGALGNVEWGNGIDRVNFLKALANSTAFGESNPFTTDDTAAEVAEKIGAFADGSAAAEQFAKLALANKTGTPTTLTATTDLAKGYYLIVDTTKVSGEDDVANPALLQVTDDITIASKTSKPTVDKQVLDETDDAEKDSTDGWGETADHAINETFQFKLTANLPADIGFDRYDKYEAKFTDTWSAGITYEDIESITVDGIDVTDSVTPTVNTTNRTMTIDIPDVKAIDGVKLSDGADIVVVYNAHLNEDAVVANDATIKAGTADDNQNKVYLEYSNNPDATGTGKTAEDYVYVFTYEVDNTKYKNEVKEGNEFGGAGFRLYAADGETEIGLILDNGVYRPIKGTETAVEMFSAEGTGIFNIVGLDAGEYVLKETTTPAGYNTCADIAIVIDATHIEDANGATVTFTEDTEGMENNIVNKSGTILPETGGIGTTIFYVAGGLLVLAACVLLITKKRMSVKD